MCLLCSGTVCRLLTECQKARQIHIAPDLGRLFANHSKPLLAMLTVTPYNRKPCNVSMQPLPISIPLCLIAFILRLSAISTRLALRRNHLRGSQSVPAFCELANGSVRRASTEPAPVPKISGCITAGLLHCKSIRFLFFTTGEKRIEDQSLTRPTFSANLQPTLLFSRSLDFIRLANHNLPRSIQSRRCSSISHAISTKLRFMVMTELLVARTSHHGQTSHALPISDYYPNRPWSI